MTESNRPQVNRVLVAVIAVGCLLTGIAIAVVDSPNNFWCGSFVRVGLLMSAFWIGLPSKGRAAAWADLNPWWIVGIAALLLVIVRRPRILLPFLVVAVVLGVLVPKLTRSLK
ncbi:hypothetical protein KOR42_04040 [Thalassoglobus neptunius]|uniref:Uncharacterized protein n=1 Tax=Thalassoglobus neptunius TaxID=1938619 RepID=A0A5C5X292_9PLAN|nr:hypothetical protein [Thalassoglobus neptunius]TWT57046.1 hypothetical protein KOR42_04040 [Thalassoglobus neptunius]